MDDPDELQDNPTVGSSTIQVVDSSTPTDNIDMLLPERNAMFDATGMIMEDAVLPDHGSYMEPDQTDHNPYPTIGESSNNYVGSSDQPSSRPDDEAGPSHADDDMITSGQITSSSSTKGLHMRGCRNMEDSQSPQAVPEVDVFVHKPSSSELDQVASSSISTDEASSNTIGGEEGLQSQVSSGIADVVENSADYAIDDESIAEGLSMQDSELQVVPDSGGSLKQPDTSTCWSNEAVTSGNSEQTPEEQVCQAYPTTSEAQMVPVSSNTLSECHEADITTNSELISQESGYLSQQPEVSHSELEDDVQMAETSQVHVTSSQSQNINEALSSTEGSFGTIEDTLNEATINEIQPSHSGINLLSNVASSENVPLFIGSSGDPTNFSIAEANDACGETPDSNKHSLDTCEEDENDALCSSQMSSQGDAVASSSPIPHLLLPTLVSSNLNSIMHSEMHPVVFSSTDNVTDTSEATPAIAANSTVTMDPDQSVPVDVLNEACCTTPSETDVAENLIDDESCMDSDVREASVPTESSSLIADSGMLSDSTVNSQSHGIHAFSQTNNEAAHLEIGNRYVCVPSRSTTSQMTGYLSQNDEIPAEPDSGSAITEATGEDMGPCDGGTSLTMDDEEDVDHMDSPEEEYAVHLQQVDSGSEEVTYLVQEGQEGAETFRLVTERQLKEMQAQDCEISAQVLSTTQEMEKCNTQEHSNGQQYVVQTQMGTEEVLLHLPNVIQATESGESIGPHIITLDSQQEIELIKSIPASAGLSPILATSSVTPRTVVERQPANVLSDTSTGCIKNFQSNQPTSLLRSLNTAATVNTTSICTPIATEMEAPSTSRRITPAFNSLPEQPVIQQIVYQTQQDVEPEFQIIPSGTVFPQVARPGQSILRPIVPTSTFQTAVKVEPMIQTEVVYAEPREEIEVLNNITYQPVPSTIIQQALAAEGMLDAVEHQRQPIMLAEQDLTNHLTMAMAHGEIMQAEEYEAGIEIQGSTPQVIDLANGGSNAISADNMQALLQILQALPFTAQGQTVQIVLQGGNNTTPTLSGQEVYEVSECAAMPQMKEQVLHLMQMPNNGNTTPSKTVADMAVQVGPGETSEIIRANQSAFQHTQKIVTGPVRGRTTLGRGARKGVRNNISRATSTMKGRTYSDVEDMATDAKSGVNYYAVIDYLSEQEGYSSSQDISHHEAPSSGFMEDHLELQSDNDGFQNRSLLESTLDQTTIVSPYRRKGRYKVLAVSQPGTSIDLPSLPSQANVTLQEKSYEQAQLEGRNLSEQTFDDGDPTSRPPRYTRGLRTVQQKKPNHRCGYCDYQSRDKLLVVQHCETEHPDEPIKTIILMPRYTRRQCPYCKQEFNYAEFFQHMRYTHNEVHPYKCYYCDFQGRDRNQVKHHIRKKHGKPTKIINLLRDTHEPATFGRRRIMAMSEGEESVYEYLTDEDDDEEWDETLDRRSLTCPECKKTFKTLKYLKTHIKMHWPHRYQCGYCDYIATLEHQILKHSIRKHGSVEPKIISKELEPEKNPLVSRNIEDVMNKVFSLSMRKPRDPDMRKWARKWACPHCDYTCQFGASFRRHIRMHANLLPYKCNYCSFKGREKYYVRRHIARMHRGLPEIVVENTAENRACDTSSDEDFQAKGLRRRRRRRAKRVLKTVVPLETEPSETCMVIKQNMDGQQIGDTTSLALSLPKRRALEELEPFLTLGKTQHRKSIGIENKEFSQEADLPCKQLDHAEEKVGYYSRTLDGETVVCKICGQKFHADIFYKHARKHFKVKPFKCAYCDYMAIERAKIRVHITFKHPLLSFKIEECHAWNLLPYQINKVFVDTCEAQQWKPVEVRFTCPVCQQQIDGEECSLREHLCIHYNYKPYKCTSCAMTFPSQEIARVHMVTDHDLESEAIAMDGDFPEEIENTIQQLLKEIEEAKVMEAIPHVPIKRKRGRPPKVEKNHNLFQCPICDRQLKCNTTTIRRHFYSHYEYKPFKCGYCSFKATSDNEVKQHSANHGNVPCNIVLSEETMPPKLDKTLEKFLDAICLTPRPKTLPAVATSLSGSESLLQTDEGRRWKDLLTRGVCPWCMQKIGHFRPTAYRHLKQHFQCHPFKCGHCDYKGVERLEIKQHIAEIHPNCSIAIVGPTVDIAETEIGLRRFLWGKSCQTVNVYSARTNILADVDNSAVNGKLFQTMSFHEDPIPSLPADFRKGKPSRLVPRKESYHSDSELLAFKDLGINSLRAYKSENEGSTDSSDSNERHLNRNKLLIWDDVEDAHIPEDFVVPQALLQDVLYLLKLSSLPHDTSMFKKKGDWHRCNQCRRRFRKYNALKQHIENEHTVQALSYFCCYCDFVHSEKRTVKTHILSKHPGRRLLIKEKINVPRSGSSKRRREEDAAYIAKVYREPKRSRVEGEAEDEDDEMVTESNQHNDLEESVANIQRYLDHLQQPLKRKRGRPRKNYLPSNMPNIQVKQELDSDSFVGDTSTQGNTKEVVVHVTVTQAYPPSKRRGRPRKLALPLVSTELVSEPTDGHEHNVKNLPTTNTVHMATHNTVQLIGATPPIQRKRGRPRKYPSPGTNTGDTIMTFDESTSVENTHPQFIVIDKCIQRVLCPESAGGSGIENTVADATCTMQDIVSAVELKDDSTAQENILDFDEMLLQLANGNAAEYRYKIDTKLGMGQETIKIVAGNPPRIVRQTGEEEVLVEEDLENLKKYGENLPKILKLLSLRPSK